MRIIVAFISDKDTVIRLGRDKEGYNVEELNTGEPVSGSGIQGLDLITATSTLYSLLQKWVNKGERFDRVK